MEPGRPQQGIPGFRSRLVSIAELQEEEPWGPAVTVATAAGVLLYGADPNIILDEEDDVRALAIGCALEVAERIDRNRRMDLANKLAACFGEG